MTSKPNEKFCFSPGQLIKLIANPYASQEIYGAIPVYHPNNKLLYLSSRDIGLYLGHFPEMNDIEIQSNETFNALFGDVRVWIDPKYFEAA